MPLSRPRSARPPDLLLRQPGPRRLEVITRRHQQACLTAIGPDEIRRRFGGSDDEAWLAIVEMDPSVNHRHLQWLCRRVEAGKLKPEDFYKAAPLLQELRRTAPLLRASGITRDLNQYSGLPELSAALRPFAEQQTCGEIDREERALVDEETIVHHRCEKLLVVEPKTERASCFWGRGTQWCTAATEAYNSFRDYTKDGNRLFIYILADGAKYQVCTIGLMADVEDKLVRWNYLKVEHQDAMLASAALEDLAVLGEKSVLALLDGSPRIGELCGVAVGRDGSALEHVPWRLRSPDLCEMAVRQWGEALRHVPGHLITSDLCEMAVHRSWCALESVPEHLKTQALCDLAVRQKGWALEHVPAAFKTRALCAIAVRVDVSALRWVPGRLRTPGLCGIAVRLHGAALYDVPDALRTPALCKIAVRRTGRALRYVPGALVTPALCEIAVRQDGRVLSSVPDRFKTLEICELAVRQDPAAINLVPPHIWSLVRTRTQSVLPEEDQAGSVPLSPRHQPM